MRTLVLTDLHFNDKPRGLLEAQKNFVIKVFDEHNPDDVIIMGDLMMHRKPSPSVLLALKSVVDHIKETCPVYIIRGNHDSENKSDDGVTALSLLDDKDRVQVITQTWYDHKTKRAYIPHYENEERIRKDLNDVPKGYTVFGHFGYSGCLNSAGDADFHIRLDNFNNDTFLGHIHGYRQTQIEADGLPRSVTILGTPYTTNFGETNKTNYYAVIEDGEVSLYVPKHGPRHVMLDREYLDALVKELNDPNYFTMLRVLMDSSDPEPCYADLDVAYVDIKYKPVFDDDNLSSYKPERDIFSINEVLIEDYVDSAESTLTKEQIMEGYSLLKDEDQ